MNLIDTGIWVGILRGRSPRAAKRIDQARDTVAISAISAAELFHGASKSIHTKRGFEGLRILLSRIPILGFDVEAAAAYGALRTHLERRGEVIGHYDMLIAGHALSVGATFITSNTREFARVPGLTIEDWTK
jgi:tRNA(fMet)-specific endonuclease VapC